MRLATGIAAGNPDGNIAQFVTGASPAMWPRLVLRWRRWSRTAVFRALRLARPPAAPAGYSRIDLHLNLHLRLIERVSPPAILAWPSVPMLGHRLHQASLAHLAAVSRNDRDVAAAASRSHAPGAPAAIYRDSIRATSAAPRIGRSATTLHGEARRVERTMVRSTVREINTVSRPSAETAMGMQRPPIRVAPTRPVPPAAGDGRSRHGRRVPVEHRSETPHALLFGSGPELRWRAGAEDGPVPTIAMDSPPLLPAPRLAARSSAGHAAIAAEPSAAPERPTSRPAVFDLATIDRLAEDVIRRVERHVRIERERRGV